MDINYKNKKLKKICTDTSEATKKYGSSMAVKIAQRIQEITAAESVEQMIQFKVGRCHPLTEDRKNQYAVDLVHPMRLVFTKEERAEETVVIIEIVDYH